MSQVAGEPVSAHDVAREIRKRLPGVPVAKLHKLLYYCQGHHLGTFDEQLFADAISAWDIGPVVGRLWFSEKSGEPPPASRELTEAQLNTVGYAISRYGSLTDSDLETLSHHQSPWLRADAHRQPKGSVQIRREWITEFFVDDVEEYEIPLDSEAVRELLSRVPQQPEQPAGSDDTHRLQEMRHDLVVKAGRG